jgi:hypothetical protein
VNNLRDKSLSFGSENHLEQQSVESMALVQAEIESIRLIVRRVDVQNSVEVGIFEKVTGNKYENTWDIH